MKGYGPETYSKIQVENNDYGDDRHPETLISVDVPANPAIGGANGGADNCSAHQANDSAH
ncbi:MAG: hypothetical protein IIA60_07945 [Candidatus Marinimicrobia bacterium]|nr:hypothetical protein [Candidatus Neomarinimicrobiota bacterium]